LLAMAMAEGSPLPQRMGAIVRGEVGALPIAPADRGLFDEYGWKAAYRAGYTDGQGRRMTLDAFRFSDAEGAHAAFLSSRPAGGVSPMIWQIEAVTAGGVTVMEFRNYMLRFHGALSSISSEMRDMLAGLSGLTADTVPRDLSGRYLDSLSTRAILGPVSLQRFAGRIRPSVAAFRLAAKGRMARFETPAGARTEVVFEYPTEEAAQDRAKALAALPGAVVRVDRTCAGIIFEPVDSTVAEELLSGLSCGPIAVAWDPDHRMWDGPMTLGEGVGGVALWGFVFGVVVACVRRLKKAGDPFPDRSISLRL